MTKRAAAMTELLMIALSSTGAMAQVLAPTLVFESDTTMPAKDGTPQDVHIVVQAWGISGPEREIPLQRFYVAHLISGRVSTRIGGQTAGRLPGDYWSVTAGATMQVKVFGDVAVLETIVVTKK